MHMYIFTQVTHACQWSRSTRALLMHLLRHADALDGGPQKCSAAPLAHLPLRQYEVALQHAHLALAILLETPARPWVCFLSLVQKLASQAEQLKQRSAACQIQRAFRHRICVAAAARRAEVWKEFPIRRVLSDVMQLIV